MRRLGAACSDSEDTNNTPQGGNQPTEVNSLDLIQQVLITNADIALSAYEDAVVTAQDLKAAIDTLVQTPSEANFDRAKELWLVAREPYGQTEVYRFRNSPIDDDPTTAEPEDGPEGSINAWPLGEGLIDYVVEGTGPNADFGDAELGVTEHGTGVMSPIPGNNIVNSMDIPINDALLDTSASAEDEHDVIAGYHAIEFLLWGQDVNQPNEPNSLGMRDATAGQRPWTDYDTSANCTSGTVPNNDGMLCTRRGELLAFIADRLVRDLETVQTAWRAGAAYRESFTNPADLDEGKARLLEILIGMGTLSEGELAGERMQIALANNSQEDEHSCFSDNTHRDIYLNFEGVQNSFFGRYGGYDSTLDGQDDEVGTSVTGYGIDQYLKAVGLEDIANDVSAKLAATETEILAIDNLKRNQNIPVDVQIQDLDGANAAPMRAAISALNAQAQSIASIAEGLGIGTANQVVDPDASECDTSNPTSSC